MNIEITKKTDTKAHYITIPRDIVMDKTYPFGKDIITQPAHIIIDEEEKVLIIKPGLAPKQE